MFSLVTSDLFADHLNPPGHPERATRAHVMQAVTAKWHAAGIPVLAPRHATRDELARIHAPAYIERIEATTRRAAMLDADTFTSPDTAGVAALAAGAAIVGVDAALENRGPEGVRHAAPGSGAAGAGSKKPEVEPASSLVMVRPPGHHAEASRAMGFCIYNNVAIAAAHALGRGLGRVAIVDYDVHHGNGTQRSFYDDPRVLFISIHEFPFYPGTGGAGEAGVGRGEGYTVNVPVEAGATDGDYAMVFDRVVLPILDAYRAELLLVSAGFDPHLRDPLANMCLSVAGFDALALRLRNAAVAGRYPVVFVTEGGYNLKALGACLDGIARTMTSAAPELAARGLSIVRPAVTEGEPLSPDEAPLFDVPTPEPTDRGRLAVDVASAAQKRYWPTL